MVESTAVVVDPNNENMLNLQDLNDDCLIAIFDRLDVETLYIMCFVSKAIRQIVVKKVISRKFIDFVLLSKRFSITALLEMFGKSMTRIKISESVIQCRDPSLSKFEEFLLLLTRYGCKGNLIDVDLAFCIIPSIVNHQRLLTKSIEYFSNVKTLRFRAEQIFISQIVVADAFLNVFPFDNVSKLCLDSISTAGNWLRSDAVKNVEHLQIYNSQVNVENFQFFTTRASSLKSFTFSGYSSNSDPYKLLKIVVQNAQTICEIHEKTSPYLFIPMGNLISNLSRDCMKDLNLTKLSITSYHPTCEDLYQLINGLANTNTLKTLSLSFASRYQIVGGRAIDETTWRKFTNLTVLHLLDVPKSKARRGFVKTLCQNIVNLQAISFEDYTVTQMDLEIMLRNVPKLRWLDIRAYVNLSSRFYLKMLKMKKRFLIKHKVREGYPVVITFEKRYNYLVSSCKNALQEHYDDTTIALCVSSN